MRRFLPNVVGRDCTSCNVMMPVSGRTRLFLERDVVLHHTLRLLFLVFRVCLAQGFLRRQERVHTIGKHSSNLIMNLGIASLQIPKLAGPTDHLSDESFSCWLFTRKRM